MFGHQVETVAELTQDGQKTYATGWQADGKAVQLRLSAEGKILEKLKQADLDSLPAPVKESILKEAGKGKIVRTVEIAKGDEKTYAALWIEDGKTLVQARVAADGKLLDKKTAGVVRDAPASQPSPATGPAPAKK